MTNQKLIEKRSFYGIEKEKLDAAAFCLCRGRKEKDGFVRCFVGAEHHAWLGSVLLYVSGHLPVCSRNGCSRRGCQVVSVGACNLCS